MYIYIGLRFIEEDVLTYVADPDTCNDVYTHVCVLVRVYVHVYIHTGLRFIEEDVLTYIADPDRISPRIRLVREKRRERERRTQKRQ